MKVLPVLAAVAVATTTATAAFEPPKRIGGSVPQPPVNALGWVEAVIDLEIDSSGGIAKATGLRATPDGIDRILPSLKNWKFTPARFEGKPVSSHVLVAAMMRPAQFFDPAGGSAPQILQEPASDMPFPGNMTRPAYPVKAVGNRSVLVEVLIRTDGQIEAAKVVGASSGFDGAALAAAKSWTFKPPRHEGKDVAGVAYLIFGFRMPV